MFGNRNNRVDLIAMFGVDNLNKIEKSVDLATSINNVYVLEFYKVVNFLQNFYYIRLIY